MRNLIISRRNWCGKEAAWLCWVWAVLHIEVSLGFFFILSIGKFVTMVVFAVFLWFISGSDEQKFLEASIAYVSGNPILSDKEFDELKMKLKVSARLFSYLCVVFNLQEFTHLSWHNSYPINLHFSYYKNVCGLSWSNILLLLVLIVSCRPTNYS